MLKKVDETTDKKAVNIESSKDEAILLFEFLSRFNDINGNLLFEDPSKQRVLWDIL